MRRRLKTLLNGKVVVFGIGNRLRGDDAIGPELVDRIGGRVGAVCVNGENAPEMYLGRIARESPDVVLVVDAVHLGRSAGAIGVLEPEDLSQPFFTTHDLPLRFLIDRLRTRTRCRVCILGVQPKRLSIGSGLSRSGRRALRLLERLLAEVLPAEKNRE